MENTKYDDKFYRLPKRLFKEDQFRSMTNEAKALYMILLDRRCFRLTAIVLMHRRISLRNMQNFRIWRL